ncbi:MAG: tRNA (adenosine(37)-N6)-dimethylallyltransferase MiaA [Saccharofermentanales bacterium]
MDELKNSGNSTSAKALPGPVIIITGPTASGKSSAAILLAQKIDGEIVCADSMQIYKDMDIGTAKVTESETGCIKHHLFSMISPEETFSVARYVESATRTIRDILGRGKVPILCGGTGQYISALIDGIEFIRFDIDYALRARLELEAEQSGLQILYEKLRQIDPDTAEILHENDSKRIIRALEVFELTGLTKTQINKKSREKGPDFTFLSFCINPERTKLYQSIDLRVDEMMKNGLIDELMQLRGKYHSMSKTAAQAIGYKEMDAYLDGVISYEDAVSAIKQASRNYAKRQLTWFRKIPSLIWIDHHDKAETVRILSEHYFEFVGK